MLTYLAVPYTHEDASVREDRFHKVNKLAAELMSEGHHVFSPISHTHPIAIDGDLPTDWGFWEQYDRIMLGMSTLLLVYMLPGWQESTGVQSEIKLAKVLGVEIQYIPGEEDVEEK